jgi:hypothetical protein
MRNVSWTADEPVMLAILFLMFCVQVFGNNCNKSELHSRVNKSRLNLENACCHFVQRLLSSFLLSKKFKIEIYKTMIFPVVLHGCETLSVTLGKEYRLRMFDNRMLRRIFHLIGRKWQEAAKDCIVRSFITCTLHKILLG